MGNRSSGRWAIALFVFATESLCASVHAAPQVDSTLSIPIAPFAGPLSTRPEDQADIGFWGTDMGFYFEHEGALWFLFGDTARDGRTGAHIAPPSGDPPGDDALGIVCLRHGALCPDDVLTFATGHDVEDFIATHAAGVGQPAWHAAGPPVRFPTYSTGDSESLRPITVLNHGAAPRSMILPIPGPGFSNNKQATEAAAFAVFNGPAARCVWGCPEGFECNRAAGVYQHPADLAFGADDGGYFVCALPSTDPACHDLGGVCMDPTSPLRNPSNANALLDQSARRFELGNAEAQQPSSLPSRFITQSWVTHKFTNPTMTTVNDFDEARSFSANDYSPPHEEPSVHQKVFIWSRPGFALNGKAWTYFAYADMPSYSATADFSWRPRFFTGLSSDSVPQFSDVEAEAQPLIMNQVGEPSPDEPWSLVNMISVRWIAALQQWVMLYGGGSTLSPPPAGAVMHENNAIFIRFADQPFGPWSEPQALLHAGDPHKAGTALSDTMYGPSGILYHTECTSPTCAPSEAFFHAGVPPFSGQPHGFLYGPNIIQEWTTQRETPQRGVDLYWTISTYVPYQVVLMRSFIALAGAVHEP